MAKDYYTILGVDRKASADEIKAAYKKLAKQHHPDINKDKSSEEKFKEINEAYRVLGDEKKRASYDRFGADEQAQSQAGPGAGGFNGGFGGAGFDFNDIFSEFFGGGDFFGGRRANRGEDLEVETEITLEDAYEGKTLKIAIDKMAQCSECKGSGARSGKRSTCNTCKGQGRLRKAQRTPFGVFQGVVQCDDCNGTGSTAQDPCPRCDGQGREEKEQTVSINIPAGIGDRMQLRVPGQGNSGLPGQPPGDLLVGIYIKEHELFTREGDDLHIVSSVTYPQAVFGTTLDVPLLKGSVKIAIPPGTESHTMFKAKGKGMPKLRGGQGDLLVTVKIAVPKAVNKEEKQLLEKLAGIEKPKSFFERFKI
jgi:molecular chaperone DnaJ